MKKNIHFMPWPPKWLKKVLLIMHLTGFFCLLVILQLSATVYSQEYRVNLKMENVTIREVLDKITEETGLDFFYSTSLIDVNRKISVNLSDTSLEGVLNEVFKERNVSFEVHKNFVILQETQKSPDKAPQGKVVKGVIKDSKGNSLPGVTLLVKGTTLGFVSGKNGEFSLNLPEQEEVTLVVTFVGMQTREIRWKGEATLDITLEEDVKQMDEVVVTGIANINRKDMVGSYTQLPVNEVLRSAYTSIDQMLEGQVAGMAVVTSNIRAGSAPSITIRGRSTLLGNTEPLWVVDGVIQNDVSDYSSSSRMWDNSKHDEGLTQYVGSQISWLNPNDIETITILKDASATAMYGSKASNGVIVITTKKGKADQFSVNFKANATLNLRPRYQDYELMNSQERINFSKEAFAGGSAYNAVPKKQKYTYEGLYRMFADGEISEAYFKSQYKYLETVNTDWFDLLTRNTVSHNYNLSINGGTQKSNYSASASYSKENGTEKGNESERFSARLTVGVNISEKTFLNISIDGNLRKSKGFATGVNPMSYATSASRALPAYNQDGSLAFHKVDDTYEYNVNTKETGLDYNILNEMEYTGSEFSQPAVNASVTFKWNVLPHLDHEVVGGAALSGRKTEVWADAQSEYIVKNYRGYNHGSVDPGSAEYKAALLPFGGELYTEDLNTRTYNIRNSLIYNNVFKDDHRLGVHLSWEFKSVDRNSKANTVWGFERGRGEILTSPTYPKDFEPIGTTAPTDHGIFQELYKGRWKSINTTSNEMGLIAIITYAYKGKYVVNTNMRNDWSNRFGQDVNKRFDPTYSFGLKWLLAEEEFMDGTRNWISQITPRLTYGIQGNALTNVSPDLLLVKGSVSTLYEDYTSTISQLSNPLLKWERTHSWDFGIDLGFFNNRLSFVIDGYIKNSNVNTSTRLSSEYGRYTSPTTGTKLRNSGLELTMNVIAVRRTDWGLSFRLNSAKNWSKVVKRSFFDSFTPTTSSYISGQTTNILEEDKPYGAFWAYSYNGVDENGHPVFNNLDLPKGADYTDFLVYAGTSVPLINGGFFVNAHYKSLSMTASFSGSFGGKQFLSNPYEKFANAKIPSPLYNLSNELLKRWKKSGDSEAIPGLFTGNYSEVSLADPSLNMNTENRYTMWAKSDARVVSSSVLRCNNISLSWNSRSDLLKRLGLTQCSISGTVNNVFLIADKKWNGKDPDLNGKYIRPRSISLGVNIGF